jgi:2-oxoglutarate ferredoxin oxidoreductase subunit delta
MSSHEQISEKKSRTTALRKRRATVSFYPGWCKRCGTCVAFCPTHALEQDESGYPYLAKPENCISCRLCEKLCPDFAISVGEEAPSSVVRRAAARPVEGQTSPVSPHHSPERLASGPETEEEDHE